MSAKVHFRSSKRNALCKTLCRIDHPSHGRRVIKSTKNLADVTCKFCRSLIAHRSSLILHPSR